MITIGVTGKARAGKDTVGQLLIEYIEKQANVDGTKWGVLSMASPIKAMLMTIYHVFGDVSPEKDEPMEGLGISPRRLMQTLGTDWGREILGEDFWIKIAQKRIDNSAPDYLVIPDIRYDNEAEQLCDYVVQVVRDNCPDVEEHVSELGISPNYITHTVINNGTIDDLHMPVRKIIEEICSEAD